MNVRECTSSPTLITAPRPRALQGNCHHHRRHAERTKGHRYAWWMRESSSLRRLGQALTALSAGVIAYATLTPDLAVQPAVDATLAHFLLFLPLGLGGALWIAPMPEQRRRRALPFLLLVILGFAAATEMLQGPIDGRSPSFADFVADAAGGATGLLLGNLLLRIRRGQD